MCVKPCVENPRIMLTMQLIIICAQLIQLVNLLCLFDILQMKENQNIQNRNLLYNYDTDQIRIGSTGARRIREA